MTALTLAEFLLARVAEDEAAVDGFFDGHENRIRAECAAKRAIVEDNRTCEWGCAVAWTGGPNCHNCITLAQLAVVYADHPDYRDEWRP